MKVTILSGKRSRAIDKFCSVRFFSRFRVHFLQTRRLKQGGDDRMMYQIILPSRGRMITRCYVNVPDRTHEPGTREALAWLVRALKHNILESSSLGWG